MNKEYTATTFAQAVNIEKEDAYGFLRFLVSRGFAESLGAKQTPGKKGRGETHYLIKADAPKNLAEMLQAAL